MASLRKRFRVAWDDGPEVEVTTNAWDLTRSADHQHDPTMATFALIYSALERSGKNPPATLNEFIDLLDEIEDADSAPVEQETDAEIPPMSAVPGDGEPLLLRS